MNTVEQVKTAAKKVYENSNQDVKKLDDWLAYNIPYPVFRELGFSYLPEGTVEETDFITPLNEFMEDGVLPSRFIANNLIEEWNK